jgi:hypothetical protein
MLKKLSRAIEDMPISTLALRKFLRSRGKQILIYSMLKKISFSEFGDSLIIK